MISLLRVRMLFSLCACVFSLFSLSGFLARSLTHSGSHYASPIVHSLAPSDPRSLVPLHSPKPGGEDGWGGRRKIKTVCPKRTSVHVNSVSAIHCTASCKCSADLSCKNFDSFSGYSLIGGRGFWSLCLYAHYLEYLIMKSNNEIQYRKSEKANT